MPFYLYLPGTPLNPPLCPHAMLCMQTSVTALVILSHLALPERCRAAQEYTVHEH